MTKKEEQDKNQTAQEETIDDLELASPEDGEISGGSDEPGDVVTFPRSKIELAKKLLENIRENNEKLLNLLAGKISPDDEARISIGQLDDSGKSTDDIEVPGGGRIIEGVFDGENMIGPDGKQYSVPSNYASKSKLVEGDILKLTITASGTFVYKQIGPIERNRVIATLEQTAGGNFIARVDDRKWRVLTASVTYFKGHDGDEVVILVPKAGESKWAAVENIVKKAA